MGHMGGRGGYQRRVSGEPHWRSRPCTLLQFFALRVVLACAPYIGVPEVTENFLEIFWRLFGLPRGGRGMEGTLRNSCEGLFTCLRTLFQASSEQNFGRI